LLQRAIERKDIISALDNDLTRLLLVNWDSENPTTM
jgi:hypothetical protein